MTINKTLELYKGQTFSEPLEAERWIYRQALKDMMERLLSEHSYKERDASVVDGVMIYGDSRKICTVSEAELKEIIEDLGGK